MSAKNVIGGLAAIVLLLAPATGVAQQIGFQIGIAQHTVPFVTPQAPAIAVNGAYSLIPTPALTIRSPFVTTPFVPNPPNVLVPNQVIIPPPAISPGPIVLVPSNGVPSTALPPVGFGSMLPAIGTSRTEVLRLLGPPTTLIVTGAGETLYYPGGLTLVLQNGLVTGTK
jgi:hypothetical protein